MLYSSAEDWRAAPRKRVLFFGMSGLGKTYVSNMLREEGSWFHYSIDYRIGTRYMGEYIADNAKAEAMKVPFLRDLLLTDSIYIGSNLTFENLTPVSAYLGKPGDPAKGGLAMQEYRRRQDQFRQAEIYALLDTHYFIDRAERLYGYPHFICDTGGSICEWVDPEDPKDPVMSELDKHTLMVWIKGDDAHTQEHPGGPRYLHPLDLCQGAGPPPAALRGDGELGHHCHRRRGRRCPRRGRVHRPDRGRHRGAPGLRLRNRRRRYW